MNISRMTLCNALASACLSGVSLTLATSAIAAPNDALMEANPQARYGQGMVALSADHMSKSLDVFKLRDTSLALAAENSGDYRGGTLTVGLGLGTDWWVDAALQRRQISYGPDLPQINSWRLGAQWQFLQKQGPQPSAALRLSAWGNKSPQLVKSSPTALGPLTCTGNVGCVDRLRVNDAKDQTLQFDLIGSWALSPVKLSAFAGAGQGKITVGSVTATALNRTATFANGSFDDPLFAAISDVLNLNTELQAINYSIRTAQAGFNLTYSTGPWHWRGGYVLQSIQRTAVDDVIRAKNKKPYNLNHTLVGELGYKLSPTLLFFTRGQVMSHQFVAEVPLLYNSLTSHRFNQRYGLLSIGLIASFH